jgi:hypothetical protein
VRAVTYDFNKGVRTGLKSTRLGFSSGWKIEHVLSLVLFFVQLNIIYGASLAGISVFE